MVKGFRGTQTQAGADRQIAQEFVHDTNHVGGPGKPASTQMPCLMSFSPASRPRLYSRVQRQLDREDRFADRDISTEAL